ncbi:MAG: bifunctional phosphoribosylaminoimidazolecarboxamide formyltransferase/IMP cyclohydrolase [Selenomonadales bacterium]|nr:bifunctional phosphoribosylaminoimidazolecarboxamide formyltransferase/IMP cyclohydrolase [Selenomonadales bacterium]
MQPRRALLSVWDKTDLVPFARGLMDLGFTILSTGKTAEHLRQAGVLVTDVEQVTGFPSMMSGRVKTLHPSIHGGILLRRDHAEDVAQAASLGILPIDLVCVNLYPFQATIRRQHTLEDAIENIDIGGPTLIRAAAKNQAFVTTVTNPRQYANVLTELCEQGEVSPALRSTLAAEAFFHTAHYDSTISLYFHRAFELPNFPREMALPMELAQELRYGENPHQKGAYYRHPGAGEGLAGMRQLQGKELSYCNINDVSAALAVLGELDQPAAVAIKHANPCGVAVSHSAATAYAKAYAADTVSIFGGIVALNREVDLTTAALLGETFLEVVVAPKFSCEAREHLGKRRNLRLLEVSLKQEKSRLPAWDVRRVEGGYLVQTPDATGPKRNWRVVTSAMPTDSQLDDLKLAWQVVRHVSSNAIVLVKNGATVGIGGGQTNRIDAATQAIQRAGEQARGAVLASDAFFPMPDVLEQCALAGVAAVIQPGGSIRDSDSLAVAERVGICMIYTGERHFRH